MRDILTRATSHAQAVRPLFLPISLFAHLNTTIQSVAAEYLARGYTLSDQILQRAIELDQQHGISNRFLTYIQGLDTTLGTLRPLCKTARVADLCALQARRLSDLRRRSLESSRRR